MLPPLISAFLFRALSRQKKDRQIVARGEEQSEAEGESRIIRLAKMKKQRDAGYYSFLCSFAALQTCDIGSKLKQDNDVYEEMTSVLSGDDTKKKNENKNKKRRDDKKPFCWNTGQETIIIMFLKPIMDGVVW